MNIHDNPEGFIAALAAIGAAIGLGKLLASDEKLSVRLLLGRATVTAGLGVAAGTLMLWVPDAHPVLLFGGAAGLASLGTSTLEYILKARLAGKAP